ncbi:MAG: ABC transporter ATP-binding protein [Erysipelotrichaceae bacterium]|nr:ABC transporter ATP-binding protein [Erysipelotrichaceae bacterium]
MSVIECNNVSIRYITGDLKAIGLKEFVVRKLSGTYHVENFYADKHITFKLEKGDMLGIIGSNGAGKSTLLKAITGILLPVEGSVKVEGKIAALLELTSGFDGDMTVRENAYLRGAMLGYTKQFMDDKYDEIIRFAELEKFQDHYFKQLSSGMRSRLAFSIACLVNPDVLILDEVLSVGDGAFRKKSGDKMKEILAGGITGILVSHSLSQIRELCNKILWIDHGNQIAFTDDVELYCDAYEQFLRTKRLPASMDDIYELAADHRQLMREKEEEKMRTEAEKLQHILEEGDRQSAINASINILKKSCPSALNPEYLTENKE